MKCYQGQRSVCQIETRMSVRRSCSGLCLNPQGEKGICEQSQTPLTPFESSFRIFIFTESHLYSRKIIEQTAELEQRRQVLSSNLLSCVRCLCYLPSVHHLPVYDLAVICQSLVYLLILIILCPPSTLHPSTDAVSPVELGPLHRFPVTACSWYDIFPGWTIPGYMFMFEF